MSMVVEQLDSHRDRYHKPDQEMVAKAFDHYHHYGDLDPTCESCITVAQRFLALTGREIGA